MTPERWRQVKLLYYSALQRADDERAPFLAGACGDDHELQREVEVLLLQHAAGGGPAVPTLAVGTQLGPYKLEAQLGAGGMGVVWSALDTRLDRKVALKFLPEAATAKTESRERFVREAKAASALNHPNIVTIYEINTDGNLLFIAMELIQGRSLAEVLHSRKRLAPAEAAKYMTQLCDGLGKAHQAGIVHRDIKPSNIMLTADGLIKILDFGLAKLVPQPAHPRPAGADLTNAGVAIGTVPYMSPEQAIGDTVGPPSDVFSVGIVLYEMLSGARPFQGSSNTEILRALLSADPPPLSTANVPEPLAQIVNKCLRKSPEARYRDAVEVARELRALDPTGLPGKGDLRTVTMGAPTQAVRPFRRRAMLMGGAAVLVLAAAGTAAYKWWPLRREANPSSTAVAAQAQIQTLERAEQYLQRYDRKGNVDSAIALLEPASQGAGASAAIHADLAEAYVRKYNESSDKRWLTKAVDSGRQAVRITDDLAAAHVALGMALAASGQRAEASAEFERARDLNPLSGPAHLGLAKLRSGEEARTLYQKAVDLSPGQWIPLNEMAAFYYRDTRYDESIATWRKAQGVAPDNVMLMVNLGAGFHKNGQYAEAADAFQDALKLDESNARTWANLGTARYFQGRYLDASRATQKAVELAPSRYLYWGNLGDDYRWAEGKKQLTGEAFRKAIGLVREDLKLAPNDSGLRSALAAYLAKSGDTRGALAELAQMGELRESDPLFKAAMTYELAGDRVKALGALERAIRAGYSMHEVANEPELAALRSDSRYARIAGLVVPPRKK